MKNKTRVGSIFVRTAKHSMEGPWNTDASTLALFFLLAAAWVDPGRNALQSAEQRCQGRYGRIHRVGKTSMTYDKNMQ